MAGRTRSTADRPAHRTTPAHGDETRTRLLGVATELFAGLGLLRQGIRAAMDEGAIEPGPVDALAHLLVAGLNEAAMLIGRADRPAAARREALLVINRMLTGFAGSPVTAGADSPGIP